MTDSGRRDLGPDQALPWEPWTPDPDQPWQYNRLDLRRPDFWPFLVLSPVLAVLTMMLALPDLVALAAMLCAGVVWFAGRLGRVAVLRTQPMYGITTGSLLFGWGAAGSGAVLIAAGVELAGGGTGFWQSAASVVRIVLGLASQVLMLAAVVAVVCILVALVVQQLKRRR